MNSSNEYYYLGSQMKENQQITANAMTRTRQRVLNRKEPPSETSTDRLQIRRQEIVSRLKQMSTL